MSSFTYKTKVLFKENNPHAKYEKRKHILWPAFAYRVVAPKIEKRGLNLFQKAVLSLIRTGLSDSEKMSNLLKLHVEHVRFVILEMQNDGNLNKMGRLTEKGQKLLENEEDAIADMVSGYVFQDPWTGRLLPQFEENLKFCKTEYEEDGKPKMNIGTIGKPKFIFPFLVFPNEDFIQTPTSQDIVFAVQRCEWRKNRYAGEKKSWYQESDEPKEKDSFSAFFDRVSLTDETPIPVFLTTYLYTPESGGKSIYVCDPFGYGASDSIMRKVKELRDKNKGISDILKNLVKVDEDELEQLLRYGDGRRLEAEANIRDLFSSSVFDHEVFQYLVNVEVYRKEAEDLGENMEKSRREHALHECRKLLECAFGFVSKTCPLESAKKYFLVERTDRRGQISQGLVSDKKLLQESIQLAAERIGFSQKMPDGFTNVKAGHLKSVVMHKSYGHLRALIAATVLVAQHDESHPYRRIAEDFPEFFDISDKVIEDASKASHAGERVFSVAEVKSVVDNTYKIVSSILPFETNIELSTGNEV